MPRHMFGAAREMIDDIDTVMTAIQRPRRAPRPWGGIRSRGGWQTAVAAALLLLAWPRTSIGQSTVIDGPPPPQPPEVITRRADGQATIRAIKLSEPLRVDGVLDEEVYTREKPFGGLIQVAPDYGAPQTERSDVWILYDDQYIYLACRCWDSAPPTAWVVNEMRRDTDGLRNNDHIGAMFDTFYDRRSGFGFYTNPLGARADYSVVDEGGSNTDWNPVWTSRTGRFEGGWTVEMAIPFKSIRYRAGPDQVWGIQLRRSVRRKNEWAYLTPVPQSLAGPQALNRVSAGGTLVGLDLPPAGLNLELKPYVVSRVTTDRVVSPPVSNDFGMEIGGDAKYSITPNLTADLT
ncbi:MAG TPA: carbohydrate binding family 9 domain-containing protein, partial [Gemmatimonadaceae bacterium]